MTTTSKTTGSTSPGLKKKRSSGAWFSSATGGRRKSGFFMVGRVDENGMMSNGRVDSMDHDTDSMKENREPPPTIPEVQMDTDIGGEELFRNIR